MSSEDFQLLFWFEYNNSIYECYKAIADELYLVKQLAPKNKWVRNEKYMSRDKYNSFLSEKGLV